MEDLSIRSTTEVKPMSAMVQSGKPKLNDEAFQKKQAAQSDYAPEKSEESKKVNNPEELTRKVNDYISRYSTKIALTYDSDHKQPVILVTEKESGKVIRQIPPETLVDLQDRMDEIAGIIFNGRA